MEFVDLLDSGGDTPEARRAFALWVLTDGGLDVAAPDALLLRELFGLTKSDPPTFKGAPAPESLRLRDSMLEGVRDAWPQMHGTSAESLLTTFVQREGVLMRSAEGNRLKVAQGPFDVLLDVLPWEFSTLRLTWMTHPLFVDWR